MPDVVALAVDGADPGLVDRWCDEGVLPHWDALHDEGARADAECSSLSSAEQWTTHFTGVSPESHGVDGFLRRDDSRTAGDDAPDTAELITRSDIAVKTYPEVLSERGVAVGLLNPLPLWPPLELDGGYCVSGLLTPPNAETWAEPEQYQRMLAEDGYAIDVRYGDRPYGFVDDAVFGEVSLARLERDVFDVLDHRIAAIERLLRDHDTTFFYGLVKAIDVLQHVFWGPMEAGSERFGDVIRRGYERVDDLIGWLRAEYPEADLVVFSDHGAAIRSQPQHLKALIGWINRTSPIGLGALRPLYDRAFSEASPIEDRSPTRITGSHADPAYVAVGGPSARDRSGRHRIAYEDVTPTLLALLDEAIPDRYVGTVAEELVDVEPRWRETSLEPTAADRSDAVSHRLDDLGYLDFTG